MLSSSQAHLFDLILPDFDMFDHVWSYVTRFDQSPDIFGQIDVIEETSNVCFWWVQTLNVIWDLILVIWNQE